VKTWREEYLTLKGDTLKPKQRELLLNGPKSLTDAWALQAMKKDWEKYQ